ncbi:MAG: YkgJ family cysteine cluster protein [Marinagarivorans sp.]|nr:YkgJ family cysteine cluster protein [Marinagarivorans sp.]
MKACNQCGKCCIHYSDGGLSATPQEVNDWEIFNPEIARYVYKGQIWVDPNTRQMLSHCPWLVVLPSPARQALLAGDQPLKYGCSIYRNRPEDCRQYPVNIADMQRDGCEMLEIRDLENPKKAQQALDNLIAQG